MTSEDEHNVDLSSEAALDVMRSAEYRTVDGALQIHYRDAWLTLSRGDLWGEVVEDIEDASPADYEELMLFGVRIHGGMFVVIDQLSDG